MTNCELSIFLLTCMSPNTNVTHGIKVRLVSFWSFGIYLSFEPKKNSLRQSADSQSTKYSVSKHMVDPVYSEFDGNSFRSSKVHSESVEIRKVGISFQKRKSHYLYLSELSTHHIDIYAYRLDIYELSNSMSGRS